MAVSFDNERSRLFIGGNSFLHSLGFNDRPRFGRELRSYETPDDSSDSRSPRREFKSRRIKPTATRNTQQPCHMRRDCFHGSVANHLEHLQDHQTPLSEQSRRLGRDSNINISSHKNGIQLRNLVTFSEQAIKNNSMHGVAMCARDRLHQKFKAASLLDNRAEHDVRSDKYANLSAFEWENYVRHWLASTLQSEFVARNEKSECENLELVKEDCPICLDSFLRGEQNIKLQCSHRFHIACLTPWLIIHRDCPCCRANVPVNH